MRWQGYRQLLLARLREFFREPEVLFWVYGFPLIMVIGLGLAFSSREPEPPTVDIAATPGDAQRAEGLAKKLRDSGLEKVEILPEQECRERFSNGKTSLYIVLTDEGPLYEYDSARAESVTAVYWVDSLLVRAEAGSAVKPFQKHGEPQPGSRYVDWLVPGLIGMNLMGGGLWGVGFVIVDMRVRKLLKRLLATPMRREHFLLSMMSARLIFLVPDIVLLLLVSFLIFGVSISGNPLALLVVILVGAAAFSGIGLLVACRAQKTETISGLMNAVMLPMWLLSGTFFSSERFPDVMQPFIQALPLTQLNNALRAVMLHGKSLTELGLPLGILALWGGVSFFLALRWFRWR
jgi:ABC-type multidrug transport system permease subunit